MISLSRILAPLAAVTIIRSAVSCADKGCYEDSEPLMYTSLLENGTGIAKKADSLRVIAITPTDTVSLVKMNSVSSFTVPLDPSASITVYIIVLNGTADTAVINHTNRPHLVSPECGYVFISDIIGLRSTHNIIDSVFIENVSVNLNGEKNLRLFY